MSKNQGLRIEIAPTYAAPALDPSDRIHLVLRSALKARGGAEGVPPLDERPYWNAEHFGLNQSSFYLQTTKEKKELILQTASFGILEEAYFIEKSGMSFTAKMALLSESTEERMLYSLFSADETLHLNQVLSHLPHAPTQEPVPTFVSFLSEMIQEGDRSCLIFLIQVVLEGWGITHYQELARNCKNTEVTRSLRMILKDEARHHGSGMILARGNTLGALQKKYIRESMVEFMKMIQCGPQSLVASVVEKVGHLSKSQCTQLFSELNCEKSSHSKLETIRSLLEQAGEHDLIGFLEKSDALRPFTPQECAEIFIGGASV